MPIEQTESVADSLRANLSEIGSVDAVPANSVESEPTEPAAPPGSVSVEDTSENLPTLQNRAPDGRYAEGHVEAEAEPVEAEPVALEAIEPPAPWELDAQNEFRTLTPEAQRFVMSRVEAASSVIPEGYVEIEQILAPRRQEWAAFGQQPAQVINQLLAAGDFAATNPAGFVKAFLQQRGLNPADIFQAAIPVANEPEVDDTDPANNDPIVLALRAEISGLKDQMTQLTGSVDQRGQYDEQQQQAQAVATFNAFQSEVNETGQLQHPHFEEVRGLMSVFLQSNQANTLENAYDMAIRAHPQVSQKVLASETAIRAKTEKAEAIKKAAAAKAAGVSVSGSADTNTPVTQTGDLRADLKQQFQSRGLYDSPMI